MQTYKVTLPEQPDLDLRIAARNPNQAVIAARQIVKAGGKAIREALYSAPLPKPYYPKA